MLCCMEMISILGYQIQCVHSLVFCAFRFDHLGISENYTCCGQVDYRCEVGLLTHNILIKGDEDKKQQYVTNCPKKKKNSMYFMN